MTTKKTKTKPGPKPATNGRKRGYKIIKKEAPSKDATQIATELRDEARRMEGEAKTLRADALAGLDRAKTLRKTARELRRVALGLDGK